MMIDSNENPTSWLSLEVQSFHITKDAKSFYFHNLFIST